MKILEKSEWLMERSSWSENLRSSEEGPRIVNKWRVVGNKVRMIAKGQDHIVSYASYFIGLEPSGFIRY